MRVLLLCFALIFLSCEGKQSKQKKSSSVKKEKVIKKKKQKKAPVVVEDKNPYLPLNDDNAMDFFQEYEKHNKEDKVRIFTKFGNIDIQLFEKTKYHRANFIFLTKNKIFDGTQFYRVIKNFVIQGGGSDDIKTSIKRKKTGKYLLPPDTKRGYKHHRGVISMPSSEIDDAYKLASPYEFFITQTNQYHLDGSYTIFGKVIKGMDVVDTIANQETDNEDWPVRNIYIEKVEILK